MPAGFFQCDRTVNNSYEWLDHVAAHLGGERRDAYRALHAVLGALRDRVPTDVVVRLSEQMPLLVRAIFFDGYEAARTAAPRRADCIVEAVARALADAPRIDACQAVDAVLDVLAANVDGDLLGTLDTLLASEPAAPAPGRRPVSPRAGLGDPAASR